MASMFTSPSFSDPTVVPPIQVVPRGTASLQSPYVQSPTPSSSHVDIPEMPAAASAKELEKQMPCTLNFATSLLGDGRFALLLAGLVESARCVHTAHLSRNLLGPACCPSLARLTHLRVLDLSDNASLLSDNGSAFAACLAGLTALEHLNLSGCLIGPESATALFPALESVWAREVGEERRVLTLNHCGMGDVGSASLASMLLGCPVHELRMRDNRIGVTGARSLADSLRSTSATARELRVLDMGSNSTMTVEGSRQLFASLAGCSKLERLSMPSCGLTAASMEALASSLTAAASAAPAWNLSGLRLSSNPLGVEGMRQLRPLFASGAAATLKAVFLDGCELGDAGAGAVAATLLQAGKCPSLEVLDLTLNGFKRAGARTLFVALASDPSVMWLSLARNKFGPGAASDFAGAMRTNTHLTSLDLSTTDLTDAGSSAIAAVLQSSKQLRHLLLAKNDIRTGGASVIASALQPRSDGTVSPLEFLDLGFNPIKDAGVVSLCHAVKTNRVLQHLGLSGTSTTRSAILALIDAVKECPPTEAGVGLMSVEMFRAKDSHPTDLTELDRALQAHRETFSERHGGGQWDPPHLPFSASANDSLTEEDELVGSSSSDLAAPSGLKSSNSDEDM
jgi:Ran GTPase-activating protein (RanGAP) involved in mRNA processing and transport